MPLDIKVEAKRLLEMYENDPKQQSFNLLLLGESGSGKTFLARTARKPVHIDSFDPGGTKGLTNEIKKGLIIPDAIYENEDPFKPTVYAKWKTEFKYRRDNGYFNHIGTYWLSSTTTWGEAIMNWILNKDRRAGEAPKWSKDYTPQKIEIQNYLREILNLPCDVVIEGHLEGLKVVEGEAESLEYRFMTTGKGTVIIPLKFDEIWVMAPIAKANGVNYRILTQSTGKFLARSRLAKDGLLSQFEEPDLKKILKKVGRSTEDKPLLV